MENVVSLLTKQKEIDTRIEAAAASFNSSATERKGQTFVTDKWNKLDEDWKCFTSNDAIVRDSSQLDGGHDCFSKDYFAKIEQIYNEYRGELNRVYNE